MVDSRIVWSHIARIRLYEILDFYAKRNGSKAYSTKLYRKFQQELKLVLKQPDLGVGTELEAVRGLIVGDYVLFYEATDLGVLIHTVWDCRQNPDSLKLK